MEESKGKTPQQESKPENSSKGAEENSVLRSEANVLRDILGSLERSKEKDLDLKNRYTESSLKQERKKIDNVDNIDNEGLQKFYKLRSHWSWFLFGFITFLLMFQTTLTFLVGWKMMRFYENEEFLNIVIGENFGLIVGMGYIAVRFLFKNPDK